LKESNLLEIIGNKIPIIIGPTASGKTNLAINISSNINGEIISVDSRQIYKGFFVGTNQPSKIEQEKIKHHLIDIIDFSERISAYKYIELVKESISNIHLSSKRPVIVGGSLLYIYLLVNGIIQTPNRGFNSELLYNNLSDVNLWEVLNKLDNDRAKNIHQNDRKKVERAIDLIVDTGKKTKDLFNNSKKLNTNFFIIELNIDRDVLKDNISIRFDNMINQGWIDEVNTLINLGVSIDSHPMQGIGYKDILKFINKECAFDDMKLNIIKDTKQFAKKQMTWIRKIKKDMILKR